MSSLPSALLAYGIRVYPEDNAIIEGKVADAGSGTPGDFLAGLVSELDELDIEWGGPSTEPGCAGGALVYVKETAQRASDFIHPLVRMASQGAIGFNAGHNDQLLLVAGLLGEPLRESGGVGGWYLVANS